MNRRRDEEADVRRMDRLRGITQEARLGNFSALIAAQTYIYLKTLAGHILASKDGLPGISETASGLRNGKISTFIVGTWALEMFFKEETHMGIWVGLLAFFRSADFVLKKDFF